MHYKTAATIKKVAADIVKQLMNTALAKGTAATGFPRFRFSDGRTYTDLLLENASRRGGLDMRTHSLGYWGPLDSSAHYINPAYSAYTPRTLVLPAGVNPQTQRELWARRLSQAKANVWHMFPSLGDDEYWDRVYRVMKAGERNAEQVKSGKPLSDVEYDDLVDEKDPSERDIMKTIMSMQSKRKPIRKSPEEPQIG